MKIIATLMATVLIVSVIAGAAGAADVQEPSDSEPETRATVLRVLYEHFGAGAESPATPTFEDVPASHPAYAAIEWAAKLGIATGYGDGTFRPEAPLSDRHAELFMQRLATTFELTTSELSGGLETARSHQIDHDDDDDDDPPVVQSGSVGPPASWTDFLADNSPSGVRTVRGTGRVTGATGTLVCAQTAGDRRSGVLGTYYTEYSLNRNLDSFCNFEWVGYGPTIRGHLRGTITIQLAQSTENYPTECIEWPVAGGQTPRVGPGRLEAWVYDGEPQFYTTPDGTEHARHSCHWSPEIREPVRGTKQPLGELDVYWECVAGTETREMEVHRSTTLAAPANCSFTVPNSLGTNEQGLAGEAFEWYENGPDASGTTPEENYGQWSAFWNNYWDCDEFNNCVRSGESTPPA